MHCDMSVLELMAEASKCWPCHVMVVSSGGPELRGSTCSAGREPQGLQGSCQFVSIVLLAKLHGLGVVLESA